MSEPRQHALSFDVEEYFQVANLAGVFPRSEWDQVPSRLDIGMQRIRRSVAILGPLGDRLQTGGLELQRHLAPIGHGAG